ncbi:MAG TPA: AAA family ATPase [Terriglobales bacterium]|nr:AAA family ATPase [Terriglobales bacterium]
MRKWMRERLKRRKQKTQEPPPPPDSSQAPLQPAYFESEASTPQETSSEPENQSQPEPSPEPTSVRSAPRADESRQDVGQATTRRRRRRGRGGRGRGGAKPQPPPTPLQPTLLREAEPTVAQPAAPARPVTPSAPHAPRGVVVLAIGLPGSGKSSWFKRHNITPLSSDLLRSLLFDDATEQRFQDLVFSNLRSMLKARLIARRPMNYVDATNLSPHERHTWIKMARDYGYEVHAVFFDVPVEICIERNQRRQRVVPRDVMQRMASKLRPPTFEEGFAKITMVRVKKKGEETG